MPTLHPPWSILNTAPRGILLKFKSGQCLQWHQDTQGQGKPFNAEAPSGTTFHLAHHSQSHSPPGCVPQACRVCPVPKGLCINCSLCLECSIGLTPFPPSSLYSNSTFKESHLATRSKRTYDITYLLHLSVPTPISTRLPPEFWASTGVVMYFIPWFIPHS